MANNPNRGGESSLNLAFGSFHFQVTDAAPMAFTGSQYLQLVQQSLARIAAVGNGEVVAYEETFESNRWERPKKPKAYSETATPLPHLDLVEIGFNLHVPAHVQSALANQGLAVPETLGLRPVPIALLSKLLELFDSRRRTGWAVLIAAIASLIGASVAVAATLIAAG
jgi:hypothetical protein